MPSCKFKHGAAKSEPVSHSKAQVKADVSKDHFGWSWEAAPVSGWTSIPPESANHNSPPPTRPASPMSSTISLTEDLKEGESLIQSLKALTLAMKPDSNMDTCDELIGDLECVFRRISHEITRKQSQDPIDVLLDSTIHKDVSKIIEIFKLRSGINGSSDFVDVALNNTAAVEKLEEEIKETIKAQTTTYFKNIENNIKERAVDAIIRKAQEKVKEDLLVQFDFVKDKQSIIHDGGSAWTFDGHVNYEDGTHAEIEGKDSDYTNSTKVFTPDEPRLKEVERWGLGELTDWTSPSSSSPSSVF